MPWTVCNICLRSFSSRLLLSLPYYDLVVLIIILPIKKKWFSGVDSMFIFQWGCEVSHDVFHKYYHRSQAFLLYLCECSIFNVSFAFWHLGECRCCLKKDSCRKWYLEPGCYYQKLWLAFCTVEINKSWVYCNSGNRFLKK